MGPHRALKYYRHGAFGMVQIQKPWLTAHQMWILKIALYTISSPTYSKTYLILNQLSKHHGTCVKKFDLLNYKTYAGFLLGKTVDNEENDQGVIAHSSLTTRGFHHSKNASHRLGMCGSKNSIQHRHFPSLRSRQTRSRDAMDGKQIDCGGCPPACSGRNSYQRLQHGDLQDLQDFTICK